VKYNSVALVPEGGPFRGGWTHTYVFKFDEVVGARLEVDVEEVRPTPHHRLPYIPRMMGGHATLYLMLTLSPLLPPSQASDCEGTQCSGFAMECIDPNGGAWDKFGSSKEGCKDGNGDDTCTTRSGFRLRDTYDNGHEKIWKCIDNLDSNNQRTRKATISCAPPTLSPTASPTASPTLSPTASPTLSPTATPTANVYSAAAQAQITVSLEDQSECNPTNCLEWNCEKWCECFNLDFETANYYTDMGCGQDDGIDECNC